ncbi:MAG: hypothetical protein WD749_05940 [Phycisphaerales bacterium]
MFLRYALDDAMAHMKDQWLSPTSPPVLCTVAAISTVIMLLVGAGVL